VLSIGIQYRENFVLPNSGILLVMAFLWQLNNKFFYGCCCHLNRWRQARKQKSRKKEIKFRSSTFFVVIVIHCSFVSFCSVRLKEKSERQMTKRQTTMFLPKLILCLVIFGSVSSFYLPGLAPVTYCDNEKDDKCQVTIIIYNL
jgi:hypothetical protein